MGNVEEIEKRLGYVFKNKELIALAFTHRSYFNEHRERTAGHNERVEFLGDSVLGLIVSSYLYEHLPDHPEGHLSHLKAYLVGADMCITYMQKWGVEEFLLLGRGESANIGRGRERIVADLFESLMGAIYLDGGLECAKDCFLNSFSSFLDQEVAEPMRNWKADLQDYSQKKFQKPPAYEVLKEEGPAHDKVFLVAALIDGVEVGKGEGASKKEAEQEAAKDALKNIESEAESG